MENKKTALYIRVSTDAQYEDGYSVEAQKKKLQQWCKLKDVENYEFYIDGGWSGSNLNRPSIIKLQQDIINGEVGAVVVYKLDRLSRSQKDTIHLLEDVFNPNNVNFISLNENFDTTSPYGKAMIGILSVFAQLERENIRERTRMGMYERVKSGLWRGGGGVPYGYDYDKNLNVLIPNENAENVRQIYDLYLQGYSTTQLAKMFNLCSDRLVTNILDRITYTGKMSYKGEIIDGKHEPIISEEIWKQVQRERKKRSTKNVVTTSYLFTGLIYCGKCGARMRYQKWGSDKVKIYCYSQQKTKLNLVKDPNCDNARVDADDIERAVLEDLFTITDRIVANSKRGNKVKVSSSKVLQQRYNIISEKIKRLYNVYADDPNPLLLETIKENQKELEYLSQAIEKEKEAISLSEDIDKQNGMVKNLRNKWNTMTIKEKQKALRICIDKIIITDDKIDVHYNF